MKKCKGCGVEKALSEYPPRKSSKDGTRNRCRTCTAKRHVGYMQTRRESSEFRAVERNMALKRYYGITLEEYNRLFEAQRGVCAICKEPETQIDARYNKQKVLCVDHNHETGAVRGLLCSDCNTALGKFKDNVDSLKSAIEYLINHLYLGI